MMPGWRKRSPAAVSPRPINVEICASKVVADNSSASAPQQGDTQMAHSYLGPDARANRFPVLLFKIPAIPCSIAQGILR
jgi:hypothetical protein